MSQSSHGKKKKDPTRKTKKQCKPLSKEELDPNSESKSTDVHKLDDYLNNILDQNTKDRRGKHHTRLKGGKHIPRSDDEMAAYLKEAITFDTTNVDYLMAIARSCSILADGYNDTLVDKAKDLLLSQAHRALADILLQDAQVCEDQVSDAAREAGERLLSMLSNCASLGHDAKESQWCVFLRVCSATETLRIFKLLLMIGVAQYNSSFTSKIGVRTPDFPSGLEFLLKSKDSVDGLVLLLQDEVERAKDQPGSFFFTTELGSLLSLEAVPLREIRRLEERLRDASENWRGSSESLQLGTKRMRNTITDIRDQTAKMVNSVAAAFANILTSDITANKHALLTWITAVLNSNDCSCLEGENDGSSYAYMLAFTGVLLHTWEYIEGDRKEIDMVHYFCGEHLLSFEHEISVNNTVNNDKKVKDIDASFSRIKGIENEELFFCCHRALGVCFLPVISQYQTIETPITLQNFDDFAPWNGKYYRLVLRLYSKLWKLLAPYLDTRKDGEHRVAENISKVVSKIPLSLVSNMTEWIYLLTSLESTQARSLRNPSDFEGDSISFSISALRSAGVWTNPDIVMKLTRILQRLFSRVHNQKMIIDRIERDHKHVLPLLLNAYAVADFVSPDLIRNDSDVVSESKCFIAFLIDKTWRSDITEKMLLAECQGAGCVEFLQSFLQELVHLMSVVPGSMTLDESLRPLELRCLEQHFTLLRRLSSHSATCAMLTDNVCHSYPSRSIAGVLAKLRLQREEVPSCEWTNETKNIKGQITNELLGIGQKNSHWSRYKQNMIKEHEITTFEFDPYFETEAFPILRDLLRDLKKSPDTYENVTEEDNSWVKECLQKPLDEEFLFHNYQNHLQHARLYSANLVHTHALVDFINAIVPESSTIEILTREMQHLERVIPFSLSDDAFLVFDTKRRDTLRCLMSGPVGTPYSRGLFVFDIFCSNKYPGSPPLVKFVWDGADIFHSCVAKNFLNLRFLEKDHENTKEGWSIRKVLHLIRTMMLRPLKGTRRDGTERGDEICCKVRVMTVRHAMLQPLQHPPAGLEEVVRLHFAVQRQALLKQCARWIQENADNELKRGMKTLFRELQTLKVDDVEAESVTC